MTATEKRQLVARLQAGKRRKRQERPQRLRALEQSMTEMGREFSRLPAGDPRRVEIIRELRPLGEARARLRWGDGNRAA